MEKTRSYNAHEVPGKRKYAKKMQAFMKIENYFVCRGAFDRS